jgi:O-antigen/teichoic acid export membrane protein
MSLIPFLRRELISRCGSVNPFRDLKTIIQMFLPTITISIYTVLDKTMLGLFSSDYSQNGYYEQSEKIVKTCLTIITAMGVVCIPRIAAAHANGDVDTVKRLILRNYRFMWFLSLPMAVGLIVLAPQIVPWFLGSGWESASSLIGVFSPLLIAIGINNVTGVQYLIPTGRHNVFTGTVIVGAVLNLGFNFVLIPRFGAMGAAVATIAAETAITVIQLIYVRKLFRISSIIGMTPRYFIGACVMGISLYCVKNRAPSGILGTGLLTVAGCVIYAISLWALRDSFFLETVKGLVTKSCKKSKRQ